jgi:hypothetical protein
MKKQAWRRIGGASAFPFVYPAKRGPVAPTDSPVVGGMLYLDIINNQ